MNSVKATVDTRALKKDIKRLGKTTAAIANTAVRVSVEQAGAFYMQFDDVEAVPFARNTNGNIVVTGSGLVDTSDGSIDEVLAFQTQVAVTTLQSVMSNGLKEVFK
jgi:hypothetical protein